MAALVGTSWKMHLTPSEAGAWFDAFLPAVAGLIGERARTTAIELFVLPPFPSIWVARERSAGTGVRWGAQDVHPAGSGAHTGDVSAPMLADLGCTYVEVGHRERRRDHAETPELIAAKVAAVLAHGMRPIVCTGEVEPGPTAVAIAYVLDDLERCLARVPADDGVADPGIVIAYEPAWAIGEGAVSADPEHVGAVHRAIRGWLQDRWTATARVIYGGSVDEDACVPLIREPAVDGLFVGRRALDPAAFARIAWSVARIVGEGPATPASGVASR